MIEARTGRDGARVCRTRVYHRGRYVGSRTSRGSEMLRSGNGVRLMGCVLVYGPTRARQRKIREAINKRIAKAFGRRPAISARPSEVRAWCADLARTQSPGTARHALGVLRRVFDYAVQDGAIPRNPASGIRLPKVQGNAPQRLTHRIMVARTAIRIKERPGSYRSCLVLCTSLG